MLPQQAERGLQRTPPGQATATVSGPGRSRRRTLIPIAVLPGVAPDAGQEEHLVGERR